MGFRPNCFTAHLYLYYTLLVPHTYASYIRHWCIFFHEEIQYNLLVFLTWYQSHRSDFFLAVLSYFRLTIASAFTTVAAAIRCYTSDAFQSSSLVSDLQPPSFRVSRPLPDHRRRDPCFDCVFAGTTKIFLRRSTLSWKPDHHWSSHALSCVAKIFCTKAHALHALSHAPIYPPSRAVTRQVFSCWRQP